MNGRLAAGLTFAALLLGSLAAQAETPMPAAETQAPAGAPAKDAILAFA